MPLSVFDSDVRSSPGESVACPWSDRQPFTHSSFFLSSLSRQKILSQDAGFVLGSDALESTREAASSSPSKSVTVVGSKSLRASSTTDLSTGHSSTRLTSIS